MFGDSKTEIGCVNPQNRCKPKWMQENGCKHKQWQENGCKPKQV
jgi:hypothetical protein